jgi:hypothetical protein
MNDENSLFSTNLILLLLAKKVQIASKLDI